MISSPMERTLLPLLLGEFILFFRSIFPSQSASCGTALMPDTSTDLKRAKLLLYSVAPCATSLSSTSMLAA